jgi:hypothetical protein
MHIAMLGIRLSSDIFVTALDSKCFATRRSTISSMCTFGFDECASKNLIQLPSPKNLVFISSIAARWTFAQVDNFFMSRDVLIATAYANICSCDTSVMMVF